MKKVLRRIILTFIAVIIVAMLIEAVVFQQVDRRNAYKINHVLLNQVIDLINTSRKSADDFYASVKEDYKVRAQSVAYILDSKPSAVYSVDELKTIARLLSIDEIHIFDETGKIIYGSVPKYFGLTFDSGEQMSYFKPMLDDRKLSMCQDVMPNTSEGKQMMYAITWSKKSSRMIQIGIEPFRLLDAMERSEISNVLKEVLFFNETNYVVFDTETGKIAGTDFENAENLDYAYFDYEEKDEKNSAVKNCLLKINDRTYYSSCRKTGKYLVCIASSIKANKSILAVSMLVIFVYLILAGITISRQIIAKDKAEEVKMSQFKILSAMTQIFYSIHLLDLEKDTVEDFSSNELVKKMRRFSTTPSDMLKNLIALCVAEENRQQMINFCNFETVHERIKETKIISEDFLSIHKHWYRASFIKVTSENNDDKKVLLLFRNINDEKNREEVLVHKSTTDELTGLLNRRAYEDDLAELDLKSEFVYITFDLNGLKNANDTTGHLAGDELIKAASGLMKKTFGEYGKVYRTGGDEFAAVLNLSKYGAELKLQEFNTKTAEWKGNLIQSMSVSSGMALSTEKKWESVHELVKKADRRMYDAKEKFYLRTGIDRRANQKSFTSLGVLYTKILKINLTKDSYRIVKVNKDEQTADKGYESGIFEWLSGFGDSGQVNEADLENYRTKTAPGFMQEYFKKGEKLLSISYKRLIDGEFREALMEIIPADDYSDEDQNCFLYVKDVTRQ